MRKRAKTFKFIAIILAVTIVSGSAGYTQPNLPATYSSLINMPLVDNLGAIKTQITKKPYNLPLMRGIEFDPDNPQTLQFFIESEGNKEVSSQQIKQLMRYFLGCLAVDSSKVWVNLSVYEKNRIIPDCLEKLDIGKNLLVEDYLLKQLSSTITDPKNPYGKKFWDQVHKAAFAIAKTTKVPVDTFYKVWIVPDCAEVVESNGQGKGDTGEKLGVRSYKLEVEREKKEKGKLKQTVAFVKKARLRVLMQEDYHASKRAHTDVGNGQLENRKKNKKIEQINQQARNIFKRTLLPIIEDQVNNSPTFAGLRQLFYSLILATYFKERFRHLSFYKSYINQEKTNVISHDNLQAKQIVYQSYVDNFYKGNYSSIEKSYDRFLEQPVTRRYFSGGSSLEMKPGKNFIIKGIDAFKSIFSGKEKKFLKPKIELFKEGQLALNKPVKDPQLLMHRAIIKKIKSEKMVLISKYSASEWFLDNKRKQNYLSKKIIPRIKEIRSPQGVLGKYRTAFYERKDNDKVKFLDKSIGSLVNNNSNNADLDKGFFEE